MNIRNLRNFNRNYGNCCKVSKVSNLNAKLERNLYPNLKKKCLFNTEQLKAVADFIGKRHSSVIQQGHEKQAEQCGYYESVGAG